MQTAPRRLSQGRGSGAWDGGAFLEEHFSWHPRLMLLLPALWAGGGSRSMALQLEPGLEAGYPGSISSHSFASCVASGKYLNGPLCLSFLI